MPRATTAINLSVPDVRSTAQNATGISLAGYDGLASIAFTWGANAAAGAVLNCAIQTSNAVGGTYANAVFVNAQLGTASTTNGAFTSINENSAASGVEILRFDTRELGANVFLKPNFTVTNSPAVDCAVLAFVLPRTATI
jgi:hypothetical protein